MMRFGFLTVLIAVLVIFQPAVVLGAEPLSGEEEDFSALMEETIHKALERLHIRPGELGFDKKWREDEEFRLAIVDTLLDNPLAMHTYAAGAGARADTLFSDIPSFVCYMSGEIDAGADAKTMERARKLSSSLRGDAAGEAAREHDDSGNADRRDSARPTDASLQATLVPAIALSCDYLEGAFARLTAGERDLVLMEAPQFWGDEDDTTSADLRGALHFEYGAPVDTTVEVESDSILAISKKVDRTAVGLAAWILSEGVRQYLASYEPPDSLPGSPMPGVSGPVLWSGETDVGPVVVGGWGNNEYTGDFAVIVEPGGDDVYRGRVAGAVGELGRRCSLVIDCSGDDYYDSSKALFSLGAGIFGIGMLVDSGGDDTYRGWHYSQGAGFFGVGILHDGGGRDLYDAGYFCQGAGNWGEGLLADEGGNDSYRAEAWAQGFGSTFGYGLLADGGGNDHYQAGSRYIHHPLRPEDYRSFAQGFGMGFRPDAGGGIGFLYDACGNDFYNVEIYGQGTSYWYSVGMLVDGGGNDFYNATQYSQGAGIHLSVGILSDLGKGEDHFYSRFGPAQGEGHDLSCGLLENEGGNDTYMVSGGQGVGLTNSVGLFVDGQGDDLYSSTEGIAQGSVRWARDFAGFGLFLDLEGKDSYPQRSPGKDGGEWVQHDWGIGMDLDRDVVDPEEIVPEVVIEPEDTLRTVEEIFEEASLWEVSENRYKVRKARKCLELKGMESVRYVLENRMDTDSGLELRAVVALAKAYPDSFGKGLLETLEDEDRHVRGNSIYLVGEIGYEEAVDPLCELLESRGDNEKLVPGILGAFGKLMDKSLTPHVVPFLGDPAERTRLAAAGALAKLKDEGAITHLIESLDDPCFTVRSAVSRALWGHGLPVVDPLCADLPRLSERALPLGICVLTRVIDAAVESDAAGDSLAIRKYRRTVRKAVFPYLESDDPVVRGAAVEAGLSLGGESLERYIGMIVEDEFDPYVLGKYRSAIGE